MSVDAVRAKRNRVLYDALRDVAELPVPVLWTRHSRERLAEMGRAGIRVSDAGAALTSGAAHTGWSPTYKCPIRRIGEVSVVLAVGDRGDVIVVTVLPSSGDVWDRFYENAVSDRTKRADPFAPAGVAA